MKIDTCCDKPMSFVGFEKDPILGDWANFKCSRCGAEGTMKKSDYEIAKQIEEIDMDDLIGGIWGYPI